MLGKYFAMFIIQQHKVPDGISKIRLLDYALMVFTTIPSKSSMKKVILKGALLVDGQKVPSGSWVLVGQELTLLDLEHNPPKPYELKLDIVYEDEHLAIINKPAGIEVSGNKFKTIQNALVSNISISTEPDALKWARPVHRLDRPTSGLLLVAKTASTLMLLGQKLEKQEIQKKYRAIVAGKIDDKGEISNSIAEQEALSSYNCISWCRSLKTHWLSLVELSPHTGRTHQLRIHMADYGFPIVGDKQYGDGPVLRGNGLFLAAVELSFKHPITEEKLTVKIEQPSKFNSLIEKEKLRWKQFNNNS